LKFQELINEKNARNILLRNAKKLYKNLKGKNLMRKFKIEFGNERRDKNATFVVDTLVTGFFIGVGR
jgi:hypothetical protein